MKANPGPWPLVTGISFALGAGLCWGLVFVTPLGLQDYPALLLSAGRYLAFGLIALPLAWLDRAELARLCREDWLEALRLALVGNLLYYLLLAAAIQRAGGALPTMIIGTLPVVLAIASNLGGAREAQPAPRVAWRRLAPPLLLMTAGVLGVHHAEFGQPAQDGPPGSPGLPAAGDLAHPGLGALLAIGALACWTWYPLRNARWLRTHPERSARAWATAQGLATLPAALLAYLLLWAGLAASGSDFPMPLGPEPWRFAGLMLLIGLLASWLGTVCWNEASQRLPPAVSGPLIVFETLAALAYVFLLRGQWPDAAVMGGVAALVIGVAWALRVVTPR